MSLIFRKKTIFFLNNIVFFMNNASLLSNNVVFFRTIRALLSKKTTHLGKVRLVFLYADRLDAIGAIGIARTFAYGGSKGREMYNPTLKPEKHDSFERYKNSRGSTINHFYEKLLLLKELMNTSTAREIAEKRHRVMEEFLQQFYREWDGKD